MSDIIILQVSRDELEEIVSKAVRAAMVGIQNPVVPKTQIKGIHELAEFLKISPGRAQKLKNEEVIPCFQDGRLVLFDPDKVLKAMENHNASSVKRKVKKK
ncbi:MAG: DUF3853 family protein [Lentimicrobiaceae bacterium]|jgi:hypothetical protein